MAWASSSNILLQRAHSHCALPLNLCAGTSRHVGGVTAMFIRRSPDTALSSGRGALVWRGALCRRALPARSAGALCRRALPARSAGCGALSRARRALSGAARSVGRGALSCVPALQRVDTLVGRAPLSRTGGRALTGRRRLGVAGRRAHVCPAFYCSCLGGRAYK